MGDVKANDEIPLLLTCKFTYFVEVEPCILEVLVSRLDPLVY